MLVPLILMALPAQGQVPEADPAARLRLDQALAEERWDDALAHADTVAFAAHTAYMDILQEIVRLHCRAGDQEKAFTALEEMLEAGYWNYRALGKDPDLALITEQDRFKEAIRGAWAKQYIKMLERDTRQDMQLPEQILAELDFQPGETVADIGAGSGYFTVPVAHAVGPEGKVLALDIRQEMLDFIAARLPREGLENVELGLVKAEDPQLPAHGVDTILMVDVFHYIKERQAYAEKLKAGLAPGGRLVVIDFRYDPDAVREFAPPIQQQVAREDLDADLAAAGFRVRAAHDFLPEQYFVIYEVK
jgi:ubiquinone/menaquinone biosynthesis C-methylase UbiE|nr:methyltransferase [Candidatus Krumholzibacteria bacterium]